MVKQSSGDEYDVVFFLVEAGEHNGTLLFDGGQYTDGEGRRKHVEEETIRGSADGSRVKGLACDRGDDSRV